MGAYGWKCKWQREFATPSLTRPPEGTFPNAHPPRTPPHPPTHQHQQLHTPTPQNVKVRVCKRNIAKVWGNQAREAQTASVTSGCNRNEQACAGGDAVHQHASGANTEQHASGVKTEQHASGVKTEHQHASGANTEQHASGVKNGTTCKWCKNRTTCKWCKHGTTCKRCL